MNPSKPYGEGQPDLVGELHLKIHHLTLQRDAFKAALETEVLKVMRVAVIQASIDADNEVARLKAQVERLEESHSTDFVRAEMYRHLLDENAKLKEEVMRIRNNDCKECDILQKCCEHQKNRIARLKAEVERLRKAGDAFYESEIGYYGEHIINDLNHHSGQMCRDWLAAKGVQS